MALGPNELHWKPEDCDGVGVHDYQRVEVLEKVIDKELLTAVMSDTWRKLSSRITGGLMMTVIFIPRGKSLWKRANGQTIY